MNVHAVDASAPHVILTRRNLDDAVFAVLRILDFLREGRVPVDRPVLVVHDLQAVNALKPLLLLLVLDIELDDNVVLLNALALCVDLHSLHIELRRDCVAVLFSLLQKIKGRRCREYAVPALLVLRRKQVVKLRDTTAGQNVIRLILRIARRDRLACGTGIQAKRLLRAAVRLVDHDQLLRRSHRGSPLHHPAGIIHLPHCLGDIHAVHIDLMVRKRSPTEYHRHKVRKTEVHHAALQFLLRLLVFRLGSIPILARSVIFHRTHRMLRCLRAYRWICRIRRILRACRSFRGNHTRLCGVARACRLCLGLYRLTLLLGLCRLHRRRVGAATARTAGAAAPSAATASAAARTAALSGRRRSARLSVAGAAVTGACALGDIALTRAALNVAARIDPLAVLVHAIAVRRRAVLDQLTLALIRLGHKVVAVAVNPVPTGQHLAEAAVVLVAEEVLTAVRKVKPAAAKCSRLRVYIVPAAVFINPAEDILSLFIQEGPVFTALLPASRRVRPSLCKDLQRAR